MSALEKRNPFASPLRLPRSGDKVTAAPNSTGQTIAGVVVNFLGSRVHIRTSSHGRVNVEFNRFTWKHSLKSWICWPQDVIRTLRELEHDDAQLKEPNGTPALLDHILVAGVSGWIVRLISRAKPMAREGMIFNALQGYEVALPGRRVSVDLVDIFYDGTDRIWVAHKSSPL
jgi:hypothetical protein